MIKRQKYMPKLVIALLTISLVFNTTMSARAMKAELALPVDATVSQVEDIKTEVAVEIPVESQEINKIAEKIQPVPAVVIPEVTPHGEECTSILDYTDTSGSLQPDGNLTLADAVIFTQRFMAAMSFAAPYDASVDSNQNQVNDISDYSCAQPYYANAGPISCPLDCVRPKGRDVVTGASCNSPLDYNDGQGNNEADGQIGLGDAVTFTQRYQSAIGSDAYDVTVDVNFDGYVNAADLACATPVFANAGPYTCKIDCGQVPACINPIDYNADQHIDLSDAVTFTNYYSQGDSHADINQNGVVDYGDYLCSQDQIASSTYQCPIQCAPVCGDKHLDANEQCDDGNNVEGDGCSATCKVETACNFDMADYNHDGVITLADAVLFTPYYLAAQAEGDIDANGETKLHDKICMDQFLNQPAPVVTDDSNEPVGPPMILPVEQLPTFGTTGGSASGTSHSYNLNILNADTLDTHVPTINSKSSDRFVGPLINQTNTAGKKNTKSAGSVVKKVALNPTKKGETPVLSAPAVKKAVVVDQAVATADATTDSSILHKIGQFITGIFSR
jgi:cysteine-rich repeat protein